MRLRGKFLLSTVIPLAILIAGVIRWDLSDSRWEMTSRAESQHQQRVETAALLLDGELRRAAQVADTAALAVADVEDFTRDDMHRLAHSIVSRDSLIYGFSLAWDPMQGPSRIPREAVAVRHDDSGVHEYDLVNNHDYVNDPTYRAVHESGEPMWTAAVGDARLGADDIVLYLSPIMQEGMVNGITVVDVSVDRLDTLIQRVGLQDFPWLVIDGQGRVLGASRKMETGLGNGDSIRGRKIRTLLERHGYGDLAVVDQGLDGKSAVAVVDLPALSGGPRLVAIAPLSVNGWRLCATEKLQTVLAGVDEAVAERAVVAILMGLVAVMIVIFGASWVVLRPIRRLDETVQKIAGGDLDARVDVKGKDEIAMLGGAVNQMIPELQELLEKRASLSAAQSVQELLLPVNVLEQTHVETAGRSRPSEETGGDFFDVLSEQQLGEGRCCLMLGDVVGHGLPASLLATTARAYVRGLLLSGMSFENVITNANLRIFEDSAVDRFMVFCGVMHEPANHRFRVMAAGHPAYLLRHDASDVEEIMPNTIPLGIDSVITSESRFLDDIAPGDIVMLSSDGAWEARNEKSEEIGIDRLKEIILRHRGESMERILDELYAAIDRWRGTRVLEDDCTILLARVKV